MTRRSLIFLLSVFFWISPLAVATDFKPIELHPDYRHDRFNTEPDDHIMHFRAYTTSFDTKDDNDGDGDDDAWGIPEWVAYELRKKPADLGDAPDRPSPWITDRALFEQGIAPKDNSYKHSGYSRGHMCMKHHAFRLGPNADWNTHTVLNACPQQQKMNAGVWLGLENKTAKWADRYGAVWIVCGPVCYNGTPKKMIGDSDEMKIAVPHAFFKIVIKEKSGGSGFDVLAFLFPQKGVGNYSSRNHDLRPYVTSIDTIEALTGLDFLTTLDDDVEAGLESVVHFEIWPE